MSIPNGRYEARAVEAILGETNSGKEQLEIVWEIIGGEHEGAQCSSMSYFTGGAKPITIELMRFLGWSEGADLDSIRGTATISLYDEAYNGELRQKVRAYVPRAGVQTPANKRKNPAQTKAFLSRLTAAPGQDTFGALEEKEEIPLPTDTGDPIPF